MAVVPSGLVTALQDRYRLDRELGQGGMATVYLAHDLKHDRDVALKVLRPELAAMLGRERFLAEIHLTARLDHPHILTLIDSGESDGFLWYVVPFIRGESLRQKLEREKQLGLDEALAITKQVAGALDYAHRHGVIHRDIKPENILLQEGEAILADFGIALAVKEAGGNRLTETGLSLGTPQYMSPEQATAARQLDARSDIYSLGAVLYEMLAGEPPHTGATAQAIIAKLMTTEAVPLRVLRSTVPEAVERAVAKALSKTPADRFASAGDLAGALTTPASRVAVPRIQLRKVAITCAAVAMVGIGLWFARASRSSPAATYHRTQFTTTGGASFPIISPDGSQIAYGSRDCPEESACRYSVVIRETANGAEQPLLTDLDEARPASWSPTGRWLLANVSGKGIPRGLHAIRRIGGAPVWLRSFGAGDFTPTGDTAVVVVGPVFAGSRFLRLFALPSDQPVDSIRLDPPPGLFLILPRLSPNGRLIATLWLPTSAGRTIPWLAVWNRAGKLVDSLDLDVALDDYSGTALRWSGDGRRVMLGIVAGPVRRVGDGALLRIAMDPATGLLGRQDTLAIAPGAGAGPVCDDAPGDSAFVCSIGREAETQLWALESPHPGGAFTSRRKLRTVTSTSGLEISGNGAVVRFSSPTAGDSLVQSYWTPFDSLAPRPLGTPVRGQDSILGYTLSWDGRARLWVAKAPGGGARINRYDIPTGKTDGLHALDIDHFDEMLPMPGGGLLIISRDSLRVLDQAGQEVRRLAVPDSFGALVGKSVSPDGRELSFWPYRGGWPQAGSDGSLEYPLYRISLSTGVVRYIFTLRAAYFASPIVWARDGFIYFGAGTVDDFRLSLFRVAATGGAPERLVYLPFSTEEAECSMAVDARRMVCHVHRALSDLYSIRSTSPAN